MRIRTTAVSTQRESPGIGLLTDPRIRRILGRHTRVAALALRTREAYAVLDVGGEPVLGGSYGSPEDLIGIPEEIRGPRPAENDESPTRPSLALGAPVCAPDGEQHGTLWVVDKDSRRWSRRDRRILKELAAGAAEELELFVSVAGNISGPFYIDPDEPDSLPARFLLRHGAADELTSALRAGILAAVHEGHAEAGTRLPSIRDVADLVETSRYAVLQAYRSLESEGIVETRHRSGVYVASLGESPDPHLPETAIWLGRVITEGYLHQVKLTALPTLIRHWTSSATIRCACAESSEDYRSALAEEVQTRFGLEPISVGLPRPSLDGAPALPVGPEAEHSLASADLVVTTPFHASAVRPITERSGTPLIVATLDEDSASVAAVRVRDAGELVLICVDRLFGQRMTASMLPEQRTRIRVLTADDADELEMLDRSQPLLMTGAARSRLAGEKFRLLAAHYPAFSRRFAERLARTILQINLRQLRDRTGRGAAD